MTGLRWRAGWGGLPRLRQLTEERSKFTGNITPAVTRHREQRDQRLSPTLRRLLNLKLHEGFSAQTVVCICKLLRSALSQAVRWGLVPRNVATLADAPRIQRSPVHVLSPDEARRLLEAAKGDRHEALYSVGLALGLRRGELLGLAWNDVRSRQRPDRHIPLTTANRRKTSADRNEDA